MDEALRATALGRIAIIVVRFGDQPNGPRTIGDVGAPALLALLGAVAIGMGTAGILWLLVQMVQQHGRLLARLEHLDTAVAGVRPRASAPPGDVSATDGAVHDDEDEDDDEALPVPAIGSPAPAVRLPDLDGVLVDLTERRGTPIALIFWDPECGFCQRLRPALKRWEANPPPGAPTVVFVADGSVEDNKAQGFRSQMLIDADAAVSASFGVDSSPMAILIDADGHVGSGLASGQPEVLALLGASDRAAG